jgi:glycosyltransferase involved in cell wall biosynthesis
MMKICYINFNLDNPRDQITLRGLRENGVTVKEIADNTPGWRKYLNIAREYRSCHKEYDLIMVGYAGSVLVIFMRLLTRKRIIYNSLGPFFDSMIISRGNGAFFSLSAVWYYLIDYLSFHFANRSFMECQSQKNAVAKFFRVDPNKLSVNFVGTDDREFYFNAVIPKLDKFTVVFRGMFLPEAGADVAILAAKELENAGIQFRVIGRGFLQTDVEKLIRRIRPTNVELITTRLPIETLRNKMLECHLSLGQLADHPRLRTTIPHKAFESMAMKLPYLTGENKGVMEILESGVTCFTVPPGDYHALARKIRELKNKPKELERVAENAYGLYQKEFTPKILAQKIIEKIAY